MTEIDDLTARIAQLPPAERMKVLAPLLERTVRDSDYDAFALGNEVKRYITAQRKRLTPASLRRYEHVLVQLALAFPTLALSDFEGPIGGRMLEEFMDERWGAGSAAGFNVNHSVLKAFFTWHVRRGTINSNPCDLVDRAKKRSVHRTTFTRDQQLAIHAAQESLRDRLALRLLLDYGIRKGALQQVQFKHFDHQRHRLTIFTKGAKVRDIPIPDPAFWMDLERHILEEQAEPHHYLMCVIKQIPYGTPDQTGHRPVREHRFPVSQAGFDGDFHARVLPSRKEVAVHAIQEISEGAG